MIKTRLTLNEARELLEKGKLTDAYHIGFTKEDKVEASEAIKLGKLGFDIPEEIIEYNDEIEHDDDFEGDWESIKSDMEDYKKQIQISLQINQEVEEWLTQSKVDLNKLISELLTGFYNSSRAIKS